MRRWRQALIALAATCVVLILAAPLALYWLGLRGVDGRPERPVQMASAAEQQRIWKQAGGTGPVHIEPMTPYGVFFTVLAGRRPAPAGEALPSWIAKAYLPGHRLHDGTLSWHLSTAALTIWISRHWTAEEIWTLASRTVPPESRAPLVVPKKAQGS